MIFVEIWFASSSMIHFDVFLQSTVTLNIVSFLTRSILCQVERKMRRGRNLREMLPAILRWSRLWRAAIAWTRRSAATDSLAVDGAPASRSLQCRSLDRFATTHRLCYRRTPPPKFSAVPSLSRSSRTIQANWENLLTVREL